MKQDSIPGSKSRLWSKLPVPVRAIVAGFMVSSIGVFTWGGLLSHFLSVFVILPMIAVLWAYWKFFSGTWAAKRSGAIRKERFRLTRLRPGVLKWGILAALLFVVIVQASFVITFRLIPFPAARFTADYKMLDKFPLWQGWLIIIMSSVVAGICEETGFRGYMQVPLEKKYGAAKGIVLTSIAFTVIHLTHTWAYPILPHIFFASVLLGILAYKSNSLIPGIIGHSILDVFDYSVWWTNITGGFTKQPIFQTGIDLHFIVWVLVFLLAVFGFFRVSRESGVESRE
jgi:membrane protease YdiL (CAAX protease family)